MATPRDPGQETDAEIERQVKIRPEAIQVEYAELPTHLSRWVARRVRATKVHRLAEMEAKAAKADAEQEAERVEETVRQRVKKDHPGLTVADTQAAVVTDPEYQRARKAVTETARRVDRTVIEAAEEKEKAAGMVEVLQTKSQMLISLGADIRADKQGHIHVNERPRR